MNNKDSNSKIKNLKAKKILLIDNYDSFTYNLVQYFQELNCEVIIKKNNEISVNEAIKLNPDFLVFSPGPGTVENKNDIGNGLEILGIFQRKIPILGVCLGHQMIGKYFNGKIRKVVPVHGKRWPIKIISHQGLFRNIPDEILGMRYHSLVIDKDNFPPELNVSAETKDGKIMAIENLDQKIFGIQFHPESIGTKMGMKILENFLSLKS